MDPIRSLRIQELVTQVFCKQCFTNYFGAIPKVPPEESQHSVGFCCYLMDVVAPVQVVVKVDSQVWL